VSFGTLSNRGEKGFKVKTNGGKKRVLATSIVPEGGKKSFLKTKILPKSRFSEKNQLKALGPIPRVKNTLATEDWNRAWFQG